jgi:hypothetical protein
MRVISPTLAGFVALAAVSTQAAPSNNNENWRPLGPRCPSASEARSAAMVGIKPFGATGAVTGGGVRAFQIDHPASFGGRLEGMGAKPARIWASGSGWDTEEAQRMPLPMTLSAPTPG